MGSRKYYSNEPFLSSHVKTTKAILAVAKVNSPIRGPISAIFSPPAISVGAISPAAGDIAMLYCVYCIPEICFFIVENIYR